MTEGVFRITQIESETVFNSVPYGFTLPQIEKEGGEGGVGLSYVFFVCFIGRGASIFRGREEIFFPLFFRKELKFEGGFCGKKGGKKMIFSAGMDADYVDDDEDYGYDPEVEDYDADSSVDEDDNEPV